MRQCLTEAELDRHHAHEMDEREAAIASSHLQTCAACARRSTAMVAGVQEFLMFLRETRLSAVGPALTSELPGRAGESQRRTGDPVQAVRVPGYRVIRELHRGGQGVVYQALQRSTARQVAIKLMREGPYADAADKVRFEREVRILAQLEHPNIVTIHDSGRCDAGFYLVMNYVDGLRLDEFLAQRAGTLKEKLRVLAKICDAVNAAHRRGIVHRDLKPANILIDAAGEPRILDFGLAKSDGADGMTQTGQFLGSLPWASPEQVDGSPDRLDPRSDVYSLGVVLYQALTGRFPYPVSGGMREVLDGILNARPARPSSLTPGLDDDIDTILLRCLQKEPGRRYQNAGELHQDLSRYLTGEPIEAKRDSRWYVFGKWVRRHRAAAALAGVTIGSTVALLVMLAVMNLEITRERDTAVQERKRAAHISEDLRRGLYVRNMALAQSAYEGYRTDQLTAFLEDCPPDLRGWEWGRLRYLSRQERRTVADCGASVAVTEDGRVFTNRKDRTTITIWDSRSWTNLRDLSLEGWGAVEVFVSPDGNRLALRGHPPQMQFRDTATNRVLLHDREGRNHCFSRDGRWAAWTRPLPTGYMQLVVCELDERRERIVCTIPYTPVGMSFSPDSRNLACYGHFGLQVLDLASGAPVAERLGERVLDAEYFPDGTRLTIAGSRFVVRILDAERLEPVRTLAGLADDEPTALSISFDGRRVAACGLGQIVYVWDAEQGKLLRAFRGHRSLVTSVSFLPDGDRLVSASFDGTVRVWDINAVQEVLGAYAQIEARGVAGECHFSPDGRRIVTCGDHNQVMLWDLKDGALVPALTRQAHNAPISATWFSPDGLQVLSAGHDGLLKLLDAQTLEVRRVFEGHQQGLPDAVFSPDGRFVVSASWDGTCRVWDARSGELMHILRHSDEVWEVTISQDSRWIAAGCLNGQIALWDASTGRHVRDFSEPLMPSGSSSSEALSPPMKHMPLPGPYKQAIDALAFTRDGGCLASGGFDGRLRIWETASGKLLRVLHSPAFRIYDAVFTRDGRRLITGGSELVEVWNIERGERVFAFPAHGGAVFSVSLSFDESMLLTSGGDGWFRIWPAAAPLE